MCMVFIILNENGDEGKVYSREPALMSLFWSATFCCCLSMTSLITGGSLNPAIGLAINLTMLFDSYEGAMNWVWIYLIFPFVGALLSIIFYQFIYLKTKINTYEGEEQEILDNNSAEEEVKEL